jgi:hypothetical protein
MNASLSQCTVNHCPMLSTNLRTTRLSSVTSGLGTNKHSASAPVEARPLAPSRNVIRSFTRQQRYLAPRIPLLIVHGGTSLFRGRLPLAVSSPALAKMVYPMSSIWNTPVRRQAHVSGKQIIFLTHRAVALQGCFSVAPAFVVRRSKAAVRIRLAMIGTVVVVQMELACRRS